eukprot:3341902-Rhodomonas_salina.1
MSLWLRSRQVNDWQSSSASDRLPTPSAPIQFPLKSRRASDVHAAITVASLSAPAASMLV